MHPADLQKEHARLTNLYRDMQDEELENIAASAYDLTDLARECLAIEIGNRRLKIALNLTPPSEDELEPLPPTDDGFVPDERDLTSIATAHDMQELLRIQTLLAQGGFECFLGDDRVRDPKDLHENFDNGIEMRVWNAASQQATGYLAHNSQVTVRPTTMGKRTPRFAARSARATASSLKNVTWLRLAAV